MKLRRTVRPRAGAACDFLAIGENSLDTIAVSPSETASAGKQRLEQLLELPGGQAATAAVACARLGWRVRYIGVVGEDDAGMRVRKSLAAEQVDARLVTRRGSSTRRAVVIVNAETGDRRILEHRKADLAFQSSEVPAEVCQDARLLLVDGTDPLTARLAVESARAADVRTVVDIDRPGPQIAELISAVDIVIVPAQTAIDLTGISELGRALKAIGGGSDALAVIATLGGEGAIAWAGGQELRVPAYPVKVVDTTGAGDAFRAGFAAAWLGSHDGNPDLEELLAGAALLGGLACRGLGAQTSLPQQLEVPERLRGRL